MNNATRELNRLRGISRRGNNRGQQRATGRGLPVRKLPSTRGAKTLPLTTNVSRPNLVPRSNTVSQPPPTVKRINSDNTDNANRPWVIGSRTT